MTEFVAACVVLAVGFWLINWDMKRRWKRHNEEDATRRAVHQEVYDQEMENIHPGYIAEKRESDAKHDAFKAKVAALTNERLRGLR